MPPLAALGFLNQSEVEVEELWLMALERRSRPQGFTMSMLVMPVQPISEASNGRSLVCPTTTLQI